MLHWEDFRVGEVTELGTVDVTEEDVIAFATRFDPQPFHVDPEAAKASPFGGLIRAAGTRRRSSWACSCAGCCSTPPRSARPASSRSAGPPRASGDTLSGRVTVTDSQPSATNPERGTITTTSEVFNQKGELVMTLIARGHFARRAPAP